MSTENQVIEERIYIGNVDYKANEDELKEFFEGLKVTEVDIPSKPIYRSKKVYNRHLGFAFVQFESKADADKAIEEFNGKEFKGRNIYVKKAVPPPTEEEKQKKIEAFKAKKAELKAMKTEKKQEQESAEEGAESTESSEVSTTKPKPKKSKKKPRSKADKPKPEESEESQNAESADASAEQPNESKASNKDKAPEGKPSADTIFITNLDYKVDVKTLNNLFKDLKPKWIHVPTRKVPFHILKRQRRKGRSIFNKGIAFVKFSSEELQQQAVTEFNGKELNGRQIIVDIAIDARIPKSDNEEEQEKNEDSQKEDN